MDSSVESLWCPWCVRPIESARCPECHCTAVPEAEVRLDRSERAGRLLSAPRYRVLALLGQGAMGAVHKGYDRIRNRMVAIKFMNQAVRDGGSADREPTRQLLEAAALGRIRGPHIVEFLDFEIGEDGVPCLVTALLRGEDLARRLERSPDHRLPWREAVRIARQTAEALVAAHREGVLHGDLKPSNLFLEQGPDHDPQVRVLDFGLAHFRSPGGTTGTGKPAVISGTFAYMAPELGYNQPMSERSDLYSLGIILYEMIVGRVPWSGPPLAILARKATEPLPPLPADCEAPGALWRLIEELLRSDPTMRPGSAEEVVDRLRSIEEMPATDRPRWHPRNAPVSGAGDRRPGRWSLVGWRRALLIVVLLGVAVGLGVWGVTHLSRVSLAQVKASCDLEQPVRVRGTVRKTYGLPVGRFSLFQIADQTGSLWVFSMSEAPPEGSEIRMRGHTVSANRLSQSCDTMGWAGEACSLVTELARTWTGPCLLVEDLRDP